MFYQFETDQDLVIPGSSSYNGTIMANTVYNQSVGLNPVNMSKADEYEDYQMNVITHKLPTLVETLYDIKRTLSIFTDISDFIEKRT